MQFPRISLVLFLTCFPLAGLASPVLGTWLIAQGGGPLSGESTASPVLGDGSASSADTDAIYAQIPPITLANVGERVTLTGSATLTGILPNGIRQLRWGVYDGNGSADVNGWLGYFATQGSGTTRGELYERKSPNTTQFFAGGTGNVSVNVILGSAPGSGIHFLDGTYQFSLSMQRTSSGLLVESSIRRASDGRDFGSVRWFDPSPLTYEFDRVGFLVGGALDADLVEFSGVDVTFTSVDRVRVYLLGGQSNADGRANPTDLPATPVNLQQAQNDVEFFYQTDGAVATLGALAPGLSETMQFGPEVTLGRTLADFWAGEVNTRVAIIKYANGGTNLQVQWKAGGDASTSGDGPEYVTFQQTVEEGLDALAGLYPGVVVEVEGMVWIQGESDAVNGFEGSYETNLAGFVADVRATYGSDLPFVVSRLSAAQTDLPSMALATIRLAQENVDAADPRVVLLDTDAFGIQADQLHFDAAGQQSLGSAAAEALIGFVPFRTAPSLFRPGNGDLEIRVEDVFPGFLYTLENSGTLLPDDWVPGDAEVAEGSTVILTYSPEPGEAFRYFRVSRSTAP